MVRTFSHPGNTLDHIVAGSAVVSGEVLEVNELLGIAAADGAIGETIGVHVRGVFSVPKDGVAKAFGERAFWDGSQVVLTAVANRYMGLIAEPAAAGVGTCLVNLDAGAIAGGV